MADPTADPRAGTDPLRLVPKPQSGLDRVVNMAEMRLITGLSRHLVLRQVELGMPVWQKPKTRGGDYQFNLADCLRWKITHDRAAAGSGGDGESLDLEHERARLAKEQADKLERERLVVEGRLLVAESVKAALVHCFSSVNGRLGAMPAKLAHVIRPDDPRTARRHLEVAVEELRAELRAVEIQGFEVPDGGAKH